MVKKLISFLMVVIIATCLSIPAFAQYSGRPRVVDEAGVLSSSQKSQLESKLSEISQRQDCDVVIVTVNSYTGYIMDYTDDYYDYNGYADDGIMMLICLDGETGDRDAWISTKGRGIKYFDDEDIGDIGYYVSGYLRQNNFYEGFDKYADMCDGIIDDSKKLSPILFIVAIVVGLIVALIGTGSMKGKLKSVRQQVSATAYMRKDSLNVTQANELFLYANVTRTAKPQETRSGGGGSSHTSSSGSSHGGGGFKF